MDIIDIKTELILSKVISHEGVICGKFRRILQKYPELAEMVQEVTAFIEYDADIKQRIHCVIQEITEQPKCHCGEILKMRTSARYINTFPKTCGSKCFSGTEEVKRKRKDTNLERYGNSNYLASVRGRRNTKQQLKDRYGVTNPSHIEKD